VQIRCDRMIEDDDSDLEDIAVACLSYCYDSDVCLEVLWVNELLKVSCHVQDLNWISSECEIHHCPGC
jgi:hypothetical protein